VESHYSARSDGETRRSSCDRRVSVYIDCTYLDRLGWEIALHGSYTSAQNPERFGAEKSRIEAAADTELVGNRQHYWRLSRPETWRHLANAGIRYDTSLGDSKEIRSQHGHELVQPLDDDFVVFP
jgi:hypothetical protein